MGKRILAASIAWSILLLATGEAMAQREAEARGWIERGKVARARGDNVTAMSSFDNAIKSDRKCAAAYVGRADTFLATGEPLRAIEDCGFSLELEKTAAAHLVRGNAQTELGQYAKAAWDFTEAKRLEPQNPVPYQNLAWLQATCPDERFRNGALAVENATKACELADWKSAEFFDTLAAAYAEQGDFDSAKDYQGRATQMAKESDKTSYTNRLFNYRAKRPTRMTAR